jgi:nucleotidyltransferase substrate binding protein (TIGR01987 family)
MLTGGEGMFGLSENNLIMTEERLKDKLCDYKKAVTKLQAALAKDPNQDDLYLDGTIQRFEFSYELAWKLVKHYLAYEGIEANSPRSSIREGFQAGLIKNSELWLDMLEKRNMTSHTYNEITAQEIYQHIKTKYINLFVDLEKVIDGKM